MKLLELSAVIDQLGIDRASFQEWVRSLPDSHDYNVSSYVWKPWEPECDKQPVTENR